MRRAYMENEEFRTRQSAFEFFCARAVEILTNFKAECVKGWKKLFQRTIEVQTQTELNFNGFCAAWTPERNRALF